MWELPSKAGQGQATSVPILGNIKVDALETPRTTWKPRGLVAGSEFAL